MDDPLGVPPPTTAAQYGTVAATDFAANARAAARYLRERYGGGGPAADYWASRSVGRVVAWTDDGHAVVLLGDTSFSAQTLPGHERDIGAAVERMRRESQRWGPR